MREIEIKASVADKPALLNQLVLQGMRVSKPVTHRDRVFGVAGEMGGDTNTVPWLRIRTETKDGVVTQIFTLKRSVTNQMDSIEHETEVLDAAELEHIIKHLGFEPYSDLTKTRQKAKVGDIELCIDTVDGLGDFVEAEMLTDDDADYDMVAEKLWRLLESIGVQRDHHVTDGYDVLIRKAQGLTD
jgi:adenylate cyclase class 2